MLEPDQWDAVLSTVTGEVFRGTERVSAAACLNALGVSTEDRQARAQAGKRLVSAMRRLGWTGPRALRLRNGETGRGYWRFPSAPRRADIATDGELLDGVSEELPAALEYVTRLGLRKLARILRAPTDMGDGNLVRAQVTAAIGAINAQVRVDEARLRAKATGDVLGKLLRAIELEKRRRRGDRGERGERGEREAGEES